MFFDVTRVQESHPNQMKQLGKMTIEKGMRKGAKMVAKWN